MTRKDELPQEPPVRLKGWRIAELPPARLDLRDLDKRLRESAYAEPHGPSKAERIKRSIKTVLTIPLIPLVWVVYFGVATAIFAVPVVLVLIVLRYLIGFLLGG